MLKATRLLRLAMRFSRCDLHRASHEVRSRTAKHEPGKSSTPEPNRSLWSREAQALRKALPGERTSIKGGADKRGNEHQAERQDQRQMENAPSGGMVTEKTLVPANEEESENQGWSAKQKRCGEPTRRLNCSDEFHPVSVPDGRRSPMERRPSNADASVDWPD